MDHHDLLSLPILDSDPEEFEPVLPVEILEPSEPAPEVFDVPLVQPLEIVADARSQVLARYPLAVFVIDGDFGRIIAGDVLVSLAIPLLDVDAETTGWLDASQRLGSGKDWKSSRDSKRDRRGRMSLERRTTQE